MKIIGRLLWGRERGRGRREELRGGLLRGGNGDEEASKRDSVRGPGAASPREGSMEVAVSRRLSTPVWCDA